MSTENREKTKDRDFGEDSKESQTKRALYSSDASLSKSYFASHTDCGNLIRPLAMAPRYVSYNGMYQPEVPKFMEGISDEKLERFYYCKEDDSKPNEKRKVLPEEQPLDFSRKPHKLKKLALDTSINSEGSPENSTNSSDCVDDSCDYEEKPERFIVDSHGETMRAPVTFSHTNGSGSTVFNDRQEILQKVGSRMFGRYPGRNGYYMNGLKATNSSGSEDEFPSEHSVQRKRSFESNDDHSESESSPDLHRSVEEKKSQYRYHTTSEMRPVSNGHLENGSNVSKEKNDRFHIQGILSRDNQPTIEELSEKAPQTVTQHRTSPQPISSQFDQGVNLPRRSTIPCQSANLLPRSTSPSHTENLPPESTSPNHSNSFAGNTSPSLSRYLPPARFPFGATDRFPESNGIIHPFMQTVFPPNHITNFMHHNSPKEIPDYSRLYPYTPGTMLQPEFSSMYGKPYPQTLLAGQDQQRQKKQRPFKSIDPSILMSHLPITPSAAILNLGLSPSSTYNSHAINHTESNGSVAMDSSIYNSPAIKHTECNGSAAIVSSPQRLSPDSPCIVNGSFDNESLSQDTSDESGRKKIRRIPPEERDEKYLEKRRKNNLAAKKSRDERRKKEDFLATSCAKLVTVKTKLTTENNMLRESVLFQQQKLDIITARLISFREKLEGPLKEVFEETFKSFLPQQ